MGWYGPQYIRGETVNRHCAVCENAPELAVVLRNAPVTPIRAPKS